MGTVAGGPKLLSKELCAALKEYYTSEAVQKIRIHLPLTRNAD